MPKNPERKGLMRSYRYLNGKHHYDELCTRFGCSVRELDEVLQSDSAIHFLYKPEQKLHIL
jgi:hypothetical protein